MRLSIISFTQNGYGLAGRLEEQLQGDCEEICVFTKFSGADPQEPAGEDVKKSKNVEVVTEPIARWAEEQMQSKNVLIFIGACGIAVRAIASSVKDKLTDSPVLVLDEKGRFVIPLLSGHVGGANALALRIAERIGAIPVITTATDINEKFAVDVFAQKNRFAIMNRDGIAKISAKVLAGETVTISIDKKIFPEQIRNKKMEILFRQFPTYVQSVALSEAKSLCHRSGLPKKYAMGENRGCNCCKPCRCRDCTAGSSTDCVDRRQEGRGRYSGVEPQKPRGIRYFSGGSADGSAGSVYRFRIRKKAGRRGQCLRESGGSRVR